MKPSFSQDCRYIVSIETHTGNVFVHNVSDGMRVRYIEDTASKAVITRDNRHILTFSGQPERITVWDVGTTDPVMFIGADNSRIMDIGTNSIYAKCTGFAMTNDETRVVVGSSRGSVYVYNISDGKLLYGGMFSGSNYMCAGAVAVDSNDTIVAVGYSDGRIQIRRLADLSIVAELVRSHTKWIIDMAFAPDGRLVSIAEDGKMKLWDTVRTMTLQQNFLDQPGLTDLDVRSGYIASASASNTILRLLPPML